jgi:hypothetical protein
MSEARIQELIEKIQETDSPSEKFDLSAELARVSKERQAPTSDQPGDGDDSRNS